MWKQINSWNPFQVPAATLAIDLNEHYIRLIEVAYLQKYLLKGPSITHWDKHDIPTGIIQDGHIQNIQALSEYIIRLLPNPRHKNYWVRLALKDTWTFKRIWKVKSNIKLANLEEIIRNEAGKWVNFPAEEMYLDYQILPSKEPEEYSILIVICHSLLILSRQHLFESLGMRLQSVEVESLVLERIPPDFGDWSLALGLAYQ